LYTAVASSAGAIHTKNNTINTMKMHLFKVLSNGMFFSNSWNKKWLIGYF